jgi:hypothetical protein
MSDSNPNSVNGNPQAVPPPGDKQPSEVPPRGRNSLRSLLWVIFVLVVGAIVGVISFLLIAPHIAIVADTPFGPRFFPLPGSLVAYLTWHIILSTVSTSLLLSLVVVYARTYRQTRASFALGIFIVFLALLFESILNYPIYQLFIGVDPNVWLKGTSYTLADIFTIVAYTVFLYLSLE